MGCGVCNPFAAAAGIHPAAACDADEPGGVQLPGRRLHPDFTQPLSDRVGGELRSVVRTNVDRRPSAYKEEAAVNRPGFPGDSFS